MAHFLHPDSGCHPPSAVNSPLAPKPDDLAPLTTRDPRWASVRHKTLFNHNPKLPL
ncbi:hypothetical protein BDW60DRAFT_181582, partial [Aspergillus nidulans var. acristatus]